MPDIQPPVVDNSVAPPTNPQAGRTEDYAKINPIDASSGASKPLSSLTYGFIASMILMILSTGGLYLYNYKLTKDTSNLISANNELKRELSSGQYAIAEKDISELKLEVDHFKEIIAAQVNFDKLFQVIKGNTYSKAKYSSFSYSKDNKISISGSTDTYSDLGKFLKSFPNSAQISNFVLGTFSGPGAGGKGVQFSASFQYVNATTTSSATQTGASSGGAVPAANQGGQ